MVQDVKINEKRRILYYEKGWWGNETLSDVWSRQVAIFSERPHVRDDKGTHFTYGQVDEAADRLAAWFISRGVQAGDVVSFQLPKWAEFAVVYVACLKVGAIMNPLPLAYTAEDALYALRLAKSSVCVLPSLFHGTDYEARLPVLTQEVPTLKGVLVVDSEGAASRSREFPVLSRVLREYGPAKLPNSGNADDIACIMPTSGTTGRPKAVMLSHNNILFSERSYVSVLGLCPKDVAWMPSPLNHATGFFHGMISSMLSGSSIVLESLYSPRHAVELINREGCTWSHGATPFIYDLLSYLDETGESIDSMRFYLCGGAPVPQSLFRRALDYGLLLCESYGSTESCPHVYVPLDRCVEWRGRFSGIPYEGIEVRVVDEGRIDVGAGMQGEEASRGPNVFLGYLGDPEATNAVLDDDGWFYSGDLCVRDREGRIRINGRKKEIIIRGGENISAREIEETLADHPDIADLAAIGMPDERMGERLCVFVAPKDGKVPPSLEGLLAYLEESGVPKRLWPEHLETVEALPYTATGKVSRPRLRQLLAKRLDSNMHED